MVKVYLQLLVQGKAPADSMRLQALRAQATGAPGHGTISHCACSSMLGGYLDVFHPGWGCQRCDWQGVQSVAGCVTSLTLLTVSTG